MRKNQIKKIGKTLVKDHPKLKIYLVQTCDSTLNLFGNNGYMELVHYHASVESMRAAPDYELYLVLASGVTKKRGFPELENICDCELLVPKKTQEEIDAYYAYFDPNRKFLEGDYTPTSTDFLTCNNKDIPMTELILYAKKSSYGNNELSNHKIYRHLETGEFYEIRAKYSIENMRQRLQVGEKSFKSKLCSFTTMKVLTSRATLESEKFTTYDSNYTVARRRWMTAKLVVEL